MEELEFLDQYAEFDFEPFAYYGETLSMFDEINFMFDDIDFGWSPSSESFLMDVTGNGVNELVTFTDSTGTGFVDLVSVAVDTTGDTLYDTIEHSMDLNRDGVFETFLTEHFDGVSVMRYMEQYFDTDFNGTFDTMSAGLDINGDGFFETMEVYHQFEEGGDFMLVSKLYVDETGALIYEEYAYEQLDFDTLFPDGIPAGSEYDIYENFDPSTADLSKIIGDPQAALEHWEWQKGNTCGLHSQRILIETLTGQELSIDELVELARAHQIYDGTGMSRGDLNYLLDYYDVPNNGVHIKGTIDGLIECLENGGMAVVALDSNVLWDANEQMPGHAVSVIGYDTSDPSNPMFIINDTGHPDGQGALVSVNDFAEAWQWSNNAYVEAYPISQIA